MSDTAIFVVGCLVTGLLVAGVLYSMREVRELYETQSAGGRSASPAGAGERSAKARQQRDA